MASLTSFFCNFAATGRCCQKDLRVVLSDPPVKQWRSTIDVHVSFEPRFIGIFKIFHWQVWLPEGSPQKNQSIRYFWQFMWICYWYCYWYVEKYGFIRLEMKIHENPATYFDVNSKGCWICSYLIHRHQEKVDITVTSSRPMLWMVHSTSLSNGGSHCSDFHSAGALQKRDLWDLKIRGCPLNGWVLW